MKAFNPEKEYKKLNRKFTKKHLLIITSVVLVLAVIGISFANYSVNSNSILIIDSKVGEFTTGDITLSVLVDGEKKDEFPDASENKDYLGIDCKNGSTASFDYANLKLKLEATGPDVCTVKFGSTYCTENSDSLLCKDKSQLAFDDPDGNLRFIGATPNNYVTFNDEPWRIIGVFDMFECDDDATPSNYQSKCSTRKMLKIIRNESIGDYSWDSSDSSVNSGYGVNEWSTSSISIALNDAYYNSKNGTCYGGSDKSNKACDFSQDSMKGLGETARSQVARVMWNTGTINEKWDGNQSKYKTQMFYEAERSDNTGKICSSGTQYCNDETSRTTKWIGKVGLLYPSDYGYATSGGDSKDRDECLQKEMFNWGSHDNITNEDFEDCKNNDWLYNSSYHQWTMTSVPYSFNAGVVFLVGSSGMVNDRGAYNPFGVRPVVYLKSNVQITGGSGTSIDPYTLG